LQLIYP